MTDMAVVKAFYESKTGRPALTQSDQSYVIVLKGNPPMPDEGVFIQPNVMFPGPAKTVITIRKSGSREPE